MLHSPDHSPAELGRKGGRGRGKQADELELSDREQAMRALRRSLDSGNAAACVASAKALIELDKVDPRGWESGRAAKEEADGFIRKLEEIRDRRLAAIEQGAVCPRCGGDVRGRLADQSLISIAADALLPDPVGDALDGLVAEMRTTVGEPAAPIRDRYGTSLGDVFKYSLSIGIDPLKPDAGQDFSRAPELLRRYSVREDDEAWVRLRGDERRKQEREAAREAAQSPPEPVIPVETAPPEIPPKLDAVDELLTRHGGAASDAGLIHDHDERPIGRRDW